MTKTPAKLRNMALLSEVFLEMRLIFVFFQLVESEKEENIPTKSEIIMFLWDFFVALRWQKQKKFRQKRKFPHFCRKLHAKKSDFTL